jgi:hypothetical protein
MGEPYILFLEEGLGSPKWIGRQHFGRFSAYRKRSPLKNEGITIEEISYPAAKKFFLLLKI